MPPTLAQRYCDCLTLGRFQPRLFDDSGNWPYTPVMNRRDTIIQDMHEMQGNSGRNWLPPAELGNLAARYRLSIAATRGIADYYSMLSLKPRGRHLIRLCESPVCRMSGAMDLLAAASEASGAPVGGTDPTGVFTLETTQCLGRCADGPAMMIDNTVYGRLTPGRIKEILQSVRDEDAAGKPLRPPELAIHAAYIGPGQSPAPAPDTAPDNAQGSGQGPAAGSSPASVPGSKAEPTRVALRFPRLEHPSDAGEYAKAGGWKGLKAALAMAPDAVVDELTKAKVRGRGGAGFPTGIKETGSGRVSLPADEDCERFVVCNADEGEPGTFKDRIIMERCPQLLIEGMVISAYAVGASKGFVYIRGEYHQAIQQVREAILSARQAGYLGSGILGSDFSFDLEIRLGAGSYLCGEELTLIESLEGKRGYPRIKPPFPAESGLWGKPTLVNNVETLAALPWVAEFGADAYLGLGTASSPGTKIFCLSGDVARPGYGEWELGVSLGELMLQAAGGAVDTEGKVCAKPLAVLLGGAAGTFVSGDRLDLAMDYDSLKAAGATLGSGAVIVLGPGRSVSSCLSAIMDFFKHESCGKCVPCRVGTARLAAAARKLAAEAQAGLPAGPDQKAGGSHGSRRGTDSQGQPLSPGAVAHTAPAQCSAQP
jgi:NADH:ubiquinone oxidoreductase subunit F (NADH-binding)/NADH:ubiquinone oxidoreductase subunit E